MQQPLSLTIAQAGDAERLAAIHSASWQNSYRGILPDDYLDLQAPAERLALWRQRFSAPPAPWVRIACWQGEPVGFVCLLPGDSSAPGVYLDNLHVLPGQQGRGIGRALMAAAAAEAQRIAPGQPLYLWVYRQNAAACGFYQALGGAAVESAEADTPAGTRAMAVRYEWRDPACLL